MGHQIRRETPEFEELYAQAYYLRTEKRMTIGAIANELNISDYQVRGLLVQPNGKLPRKHRYRAVYPYLEHWVLTEYGSVAACSRALGWRTNTLESLLYWGGPYTRKEQIDKLLAMSGLTYETAFKEAADQ